MVGLDDIKRITEYHAILIQDTKIKLMDFNLNNLIVSKSRNSFKIKKISCISKVNLLLKFRRKLKLCLKSNRKKKLCLELKVSLSFINNLEWMS